MIILAAILWNLIWHMSVNVKKHVSWKYACLNEKLQISCSGPWNLLHTFILRVKSCLKKEVPLFQFESEEPVTTVELSSAVSGNNQLLPVINKQNISYYYNIKICWASQYHQLALIWNLSHLPPFIQYILNKSCSVYPS